MQSENNHKLLLHGVIAAEAAKSLEAAQFQVIAFNSLAGVVTEITELSTEIEALKDFHQIIHDIHAEITIVPFRYGSTFEARQNLLDWLREKQKELSEQLAKLEGLTEMSVRVLLNQNQKTSVVPPNASGREYLLARAHQLAENSAETTAVTMLLRERLNTFARDVQTEKKDNLLSVYFLIPRSEIENFRQAYAELADSNPTPKMILSGAWCPFNFVSNL